MARNLNAHRSKVERLAIVRAEIKKRTTEFNESVKDLVAEEEILNDSLVKTMAASVEGTLDGKVVLKRENTGRLTATKERVMQFAPEMYDKIMVRGIKWKIKFL